MRQPLIAGVLQFLQIARDQILHRLIDRRRGRHLDERRERGHIRRQRRERHSDIMAGRNHAHARAVADEILPARVAFGVDVSRNQRQPDRHFFFGKRRAKAAGVKALAQPMRDLLDRHDKYAGVLIQFAVMKPAPVNFLRHVGHFELMAAEHVQRKRACAVTILRSIRLQKAFIAEKPRAEHLFFKRHVIDRDAIRGSGVQFFVKQFEIFQIFQAEPQLRNHPGFVVMRLARGDLVGFV